MSDFHYHGDYNIAFGEFKPKGKDDKPVSADKPMAANHMWIQYEYHEASGKDGAEALSGFIFNIVDIDDTVIMTSTENYETLDEVIIGMKKVYESFLATDHGDVEDAAWGKDL